MGEKRDSKVTILNFFLTNTARFWEKLDWHFTANHVNHVWVRKLFFKTTLVPRQQPWPNKNWKIRLVNTWAPSLPSRPITLRLSYLWSAQRIFEMSKIERRWGWSPCAQLVVYTMDFMLRVRVIKVAYSLGKWVSKAGEYVEELNSEAFTATVIRKITRDVIFLM